MGSKISIYKRQLKRFIYNFQDVSGKYFLSFRKKLFFVYGRLKLNNKKSKNKNWEITLPLYFGWQIKIILEKVKDLKKHIVGPFKEYWQYMSAVVVLIALVSTALILRQFSPSRAATYNWVQSSWTGGASTTATASHTNVSDRTNWDKYQSASSNMTIGSNLSITPTTASTTHTLDGDFTGTNVNTKVASGSVMLNL